MLLVVAGDDGWGVVVIPAGGSQHGGRFGPRKALAEKAISPTDAVKSNVDPGAGGEGDALCWTAAGNTLFLFLPILPPKRSSTVVVLIAAIAMRLRRRQRQPQTAWRKLVDDVKQDRTLYARVTSSLCSSGETLCIFGIDIGLLLWATCMHSMAPIRLVFNAG